MLHPIFLTAEHLSGAEQLELARQAIAAAEKAERAANFRAWFFPTLLAVLLISTGIMYLVHHLKNRGKPPVERKGANLLGGAYGNGAVSGRPTGAGGMGGVPGVSIPVNKAQDGDAEDPRKR